MHRTVVLLLIVLATLLALAESQDGRYRPQPTKKQSVSDGRYRPSNDGRYRGGGDGRYRGGNDGKYVHQDVKYKHDNRDGGAYTGDSEKYKQDRNRGGGGGSGGGGGGSGGNAASDTGAKLSQPKIPSFVALPKSIDGQRFGRGGNGWKIVRLVDEADDDGYHYLYETENRILAEEKGRIEKLSSKDDGLRSAGFYEYIGDDGQLYRVDYVADDNGFVPRGDHIPSQPPHVAKLLAYLEANERRKREP